MSQAPRSSRKMPAARVAQRAPKRAPQREWLAPEEQSDPFAPTPYPPRPDTYDYGDDYASDDYVGKEFARNRHAGNRVSQARAHGYTPGYDSGEYSGDARDDDRYDDYGNTARRRAQAASPATSGRRPAVRPNPNTPPRGWDAATDDATASDWNDTTDDAGWRGEFRRTAARSRQQSVARPLALVRARLPNPSALLARTPHHLQAHQSEPHLIPGLSTQASLPALASYRHMKLPPRPRVDTRAIVERARSPWSMARTLLALLAISCALWTSASAVGEQSQPLMALFQTQSSSFDARAITSLVEPQTQGTRPDLYDSKAQFDDWWNAACSAAVVSEILTAWGVQHMTIGKMIDAMQPDISLNGGLLTSHGFQRGAEAFGYRADLSSRLTYKQLLYITNVLGLPVIVNVRISYGYYRFFSGGHFLVMTGGDAQGVKIVDSSEYYIHYLPVDTFYSMFTGITAIIVPKDYQYDVPSI